VKPLIRDECLPGLDKDQLAKALDEVLEEYKLNAMSPSNPYINIPPGTYTQPTTSPFYDPQPAPGWENTPSWTYIPSTITPIVVWMLVDKRGARYYLSHEDLKADMISDDGGHFIELIDTYVGSATHLRAQANIYSKGNEQTSSG